MADTEPITHFRIAPLRADTWEPYARLVERHNGVFGGCWCTYFHTMHEEKTFTLVAAAGGGMVEAYRHDNDGRKVSVLSSGTRALFESAGFTYVRPKGTRNCVMRIEVAPSDATDA